MIFSEPIGIHVKELTLILAAIDVDQDECGTGNRIFRTPALGNALHEGGLACAEIALQADHIARLQCSAKTYTDTARLFGAAAEEIHCVRIQDGHRKDYTVRDVSTEMSP